MSDPIADMLTRIRNGYLAGLSSVSVPHSRIKRELAELLSREGWVGKVEGKKGDQSFAINLRYQSGQPVAEHIKRISRPGLRVIAKLLTFAPSVVDLV